MNKEQILKEIQRIINEHGDKLPSCKVIVLLEYREYINQLGRFKTYENASILYRETDNTLWVERGIIKSKQLKGFPMYHLKRLYKQILDYLDEKYKWRE